jgi:hypothetical protein
MKSDILEEEEEAGARLAPINLARETKRMCHIGELKALSPLPQGLLIIASIRRKMI